MGDPACRVRQSRHSAIDARTTRHKGYALSIQHRKRIEEVFGWVKTIGGMEQTVYRGVERVGSRFILTLAANNLARLPPLAGRVRPLEETARRSEGS